jgi:hypothetical protein
MDTDRSIYHYCRFTIRVAGVETTINVRVLRGLHTTLLGREWIESVKLLSDSGKRERGAINKGGSKK